MSSILRTNMAAICRTVDNKHNAQKPNRSLSGKAARRQRIKERHAVIIGTKVIVEEKP